MFDSKGLLYIISPLNTQYQLWTNSIMFYDIHKHIEWHGGGDNFGQKSKFCELNDIGLGYKWLQLGLKLQTS